MTTTPTAPIPTTPAQTPAARGEPAPAGDAVAWLTVHRTAADDVKERELYVRLDDDRLGILVYGDVQTVAIAPGSHELRVHNTLSRKRMTFDAAPGQHVRFSTANVPGKGIAYWAFFIGAALMWTRVEREEDGPPASGVRKRTFRG